MKVVKAVSLCSETAPIAKRMKNFSQWVRIGLREQKNGNDLASETMKRIQWAKTANILASQLEEALKENDPEFDKDFWQLVGDAQKLAGQTTLEEYE